MTSHTPHALADHTPEGHVHHAAEGSRSVAGHAAAVVELLRPLLSMDRMETLPLSQALGRALVDDVAAPLSLPPFANSQMDGYAVRSGDLPDGGGDLRIMPPVPAGSSPEPLEPGTAAPIMTGAMIPAGADAVVPIERAVPDHFVDAGYGATVKLPAVQAGTYVRASGSDIPARTADARLSTASGHTSASSRWRRRPRPRSIAIGR